MRPRRIGCVKTSRVSWQLTPPVLLRSLLRLLCWMLPPSTLSVSCVVIVGMGVLGSTSSPALVSARLVFATAAVLIVLPPVRSIATSGSFALSPTALRIFLHRPASSSQSVSAALRLHFRVAVLWLLAGFFARLRVFLHRPASLSQCISAALLRLHFRIAGLSFRLSVNLCIAALNRSFRAFTHLYG